MKADVISLRQRFAKGQEASRSSQQREARAHTQIVSRFISVYPLVHGHDPQAASELRTMFSAFAGKKQLRQIAGIDVLAKKQQATLETRKVRGKGQFAPAK